MYRCWKKINLTSTKYKNQNPTYYYTTKFSGKNLGKIGPVPSKDYHTCEIPLKDDRPVKYH